MKDRLERLRLERLRWERVRANDRLRDAAPDLLAALRSLMPIWSTASETDQSSIEHWQEEERQGNGNATDYLRAYAAIAKAVGACSCRGIRTPQGWCMSCRGSVR